MIDTAKIIFTWFDLLMYQAYLLNGKSSNSVIWYFIKNVDLLWLQKKKKK